MENQSETAPTTPRNGTADVAAREALYQSAFTLLSRPIEDPSPVAVMRLVEELRPRKEDYARVFVGELAEAAQAVYEALYLAPRPIERDPQQTVLRVFVASAAELRAQQPHTLGFPGGYADILDFLQPDSLWVHWKYTAPHNPSGMAYDGLTRIDDRWIWLPKPYRFLRKAIPASTKAAEPAPETPAPEAAPKAPEETPTQSANIWKE
jgi:hypothetical protein